MARTKFNTIRIEYAGADLVDGGMLADTEGALGVSMQYSTDAVAALGADYVSLDNAGNAQGGTEVSVAVDYETEGAMLAGMLARKAFADGHQRGVLRYAVEGSNARVSVEVVNVPTTNPEFDVADGSGQSLFGTYWPGHTLTAENVQDYCDFVNASPEVAGKAVLSWDGERLTVELAGEYAGAAGNGLKLGAGAMVPWEGSPAFSGGADGADVSYSAGLDGFEATSTLAGRWRMVYRYSFIVGGSSVD